MPAKAQPRLTEGRVYRTRDFARWGGNPTRLAKRLIRDGELVELRHGLFYRPEQSRFGAVPASDRDLMRALLGGAPFLFTGPRYWNALALGSTALFAHQLVYNTKRTGVFEFGKLKFVLRRVRFPRNPTAEWFAVDLLENRDTTGLGLDAFEMNLGRAVDAGRLNARKLLVAARRYGTQETLAVIERALERSVAP